MNATPLTPQARTDQQNQQLLDELLDVLSQIEILMSLTQATKKITDRLILPLTSNGPVNLHAEGGIDRAKYSLDMAWWGLRTAKMTYQHCADQLKEQKE